MNWRSRTAAQIKGPWERLGFRDTPYSRAPLLPTASDAALHVGREVEAAEFQSLVECAAGCVMVVSGDGGLGKTSFLNVQQYRIHSRTAMVSKRLIPCYNMTTAEAGTTPAELAQRITHNFIKSLASEVAARKVEFPDQMKKIREWLSHEPTVSGRSYSFSLFGHGGGWERTFDIPSVAEATLENWQDVLRLLVDCAKEIGPFDGCFICIDNAETLPIADLTKILMSYRDTIFEIPGIWWIVVGQKNLYAQIEKANRRVSERMRGSGIEIPPLSSDDLHLMIERRVSALGKPGAKSPFSATIHSLLMEASCGQPRYVLASSDDLFSDFIKMLVHDNGGNSGSEAAAEFRDEMMDRALQAVLKDSQIPDEAALQFLENGVRSRLLRKKLTVPALVVLKEIATSEFVAVSPREIKNPGDSSINLSALLKDLEEDGFLYASDLEGEMHYQLRGDAWLCNHFDLWEEVMPQARAKKPVPASTYKATRKKPS